MSLADDDIARLSEVLKPKEEGPFSPSKVIWAGAVALVAYFANDKLDSIEASVGNNSQEIEQVVATVNDLARLVNSNTAELNTRGPLIQGIDTYSDQSRLKDQDHDSRLIRIERQLGLEN